MSFDQITYLFILCGVFMVAVVAHGIMKMRINTMKGVLAERMLRRFRFMLIARILRFPQPYFERTSQGELVSMVTAESEPMGGLMGDALAQPVLQAGQMLTILSFLFLQSFAFGIAACALIPLQAWLIPKIQRQINQLNRKRVVQVRALAAEIGESAVGASTLRVNAGWRYRLAMIGDRLGRMFEIRFRIYQKKFFMKFLNNFISQLTPFFFFSIGGYLVIQGEVTLGALVAALSAYKDLSSPWKELLDFYNQSADMSMRWETITERFMPLGMVREDLFEGEPEDVPRLNENIVMTHVNMNDADGNAVLEDMNITMSGGALIGITAASDEDRRALSELLTREAAPSSGSITIGGRDLQDLHQAVIAKRIGHANSRPVMFQGSFGENVMIPLMTHPLQPSREEDAGKLHEAERAGNSADPLSVDWIDPSLAGAADQDALRDWWYQLIDGMGSGTALFRRALDQSFQPETHPRLAEQIVELRPAIRDRLNETGLIRMIHSFDPDQFNPALPVAENLLFAIPDRPMSRQVLKQEHRFLEELSRLGLDEALMDVAIETVDLLRQIFGQTGTDHPLFQKLGIPADTYEAAVEISRRRAEGAKLEQDDLATLLSVPFRVSAERIGAAFPDVIRDRILKIRHDHAETLRTAMDTDFEPLDETRCATGLTVLENAIFGRISDAAGTRGDDVRQTVADMLVEAGVDRRVLQLIFDVPIALGGANLPALFAEPLSVTRATIKRPDLLILDDVLASFEESAKAKLIGNLRTLLPETTIIFMGHVSEAVDIFDEHFEIRAGRIVGVGVAEEGEAESAARADLLRKVQALETTEMFSGLSRKQLRLLAFGARWYTAHPGDYVFRRHDDPGDGAYMIIEGEAELLLPRKDEEDQLIATVGPGTLVGELGLIRGEPRALDMRAKTELMCLRLGVEEFLAVVENDAATAFKLLQVVAGYVST